jgi:hypothetical protein
MSCEPIDLMLHFSWKIEKLGQIPFSADLAPHPISSKNPIKLLNNIEKDNIIFVLFDKFGFH